MPMPRMPLPQRRQQLVDAAIAVLTREGVSGATTRAIVAEAGTSLSVFHYCFDSKQELLDAVIKSLVGTNVGLAEATFEAGATRRQLIRSGLDAYWSHVTANPDTHLLTYELTQRVRSERAVDCRQIRNRNEPLVSAACGFVVVLAFEEYGSEHSVHEARIA